MRGKNDERVQGKAEEGQTQDQCFQSKREELGRQGVRRIETVKIIPGPLANGGPYMRLAARLLFPDLAPTMIRSHIQSVDLLA